MCFVFIWEQIATCATYSINCLVFITEIKSVYCAVRTGSLNKAFCASYLKGLISASPKNTALQLTRKTKELLNEIVSKLNATGDMNYFRPSYFKITEQPHRNYPIFSVSVQMLYSLSTKQVQVIVRFIPLASIIIWWKYLIKFLVQIV